MISAKWLVPCRLVVLRQDQRLEHLRELEASISTLPANDDRAISPGIKKGASSLSFVMPEVRHLSECGPFLDGLWIGVE